MAAAFETGGPSLLIWGGVNELGEVFLEPSFVVDTPHSLPQSDGPYLLTGKDGNGGILFNLSFSMAGIADAEGASFAFILPARGDWQNRLSRITLSGPEGFATLGERDEVDASAAALLLDSATGKVRGILRDWSDGDVSAISARRASPESGLEIVISTGVPDQASWER